MILGPRPMSRREELTCQRLRNAVQLWTTVYTEMGWCDDMRDKLRLHMLLHATCSHREVEPRFIRVWLQGPVLQDAAAANRRRCVRNALTNVAEQEHEDGNHARMSVLYARAMLAYHYTLAAIGKHTCITYKTESRVRIQILMRRERCWLPPRICFPSWNQ